MKKGKKKISPEKETLYRQWIDNFRMWLRLENMKKEAWEKGAYVCWHEVSEDSCIRTDNVLWRV